MNVVADHSVQDVREAVAELLPLVPPLADRCDDRPLDAGETQELRQAPPFLLQRPGVCWGPGWWMRVKVVLVVTVVVIVVVMVVLVVWWWWWWLW